MNPENNPSTSNSPTTSHRPNLRILDLKALPAGDEGQSESQIRRQKYLYFEKHCSEVAPGLFLSGDYVAKNRETLRANRVTHVLNCVGFICKEYFKEELTYKTLYLQDTPAEDISCVLYDCLDYIDAALHSGGRVLVHCSQGVSRSATLVIAYLMWRSGKAYDEVFASVKAIRGVTNPNIGFTCQLLQWQKRAASARARMRAYRIAPHCSQAPTYLVPKLITPPKQYPNNTHRDLDPRGAFVLQTPGGATYVWLGEQCPEQYAEAAHRAAGQLRKFEGAGPVVEVRQGHEPPELVALLDPAPLDAEAARINAKRSSITGEIELSSREHILPPLLPGPGPQQGGGGQAPLMSSSGPSDGAGDMDVDTPDLASGSGQAAEGPAGAGSLSMDVLAPTPRPRSSGGAGGGLAGGGGGGGGSAAGDGSGPLQPLAGALCGLEGLVGVSVLWEPSRWIPKEVDEYSDDYGLFHHSQQQGKAAGSGGVPYDASMRVSYDTAGGISTNGMAPGGAQVDCLFGGPQARPDSPATKEGRHKKYRRADSERPKLGYWTAACSDGIGPELARTHNVSSLHESVDEDVLGLPPPSRMGSEAGR